MTSKANQMLNSASQQFAERGFLGTSMRSIASAAGTTQAAIYHHFPNKEALYRAALALHLGEKSRQLAEIVAGKPNFEDRLKAMVQHMLVVADEDEQFRRLYFRELLEGDAEQLKTLANNVFDEFSS